MHFLKKIDWNEVDKPVEGLRNAISENKVIFLTGISPKADLKNFYLDLLNKIDIGNVIVNYEDHLTGEMTSNKWLGIKYVEKIAGQSLRFSNECHPLHTDGAYVDLAFDVCFLFCLQQAQSGGETLFLDGEVLVKELKKINPQLLQQLESKFVFFQKDRNSVKKIPIITYDVNGDVILNWNFRRISEQNDIATMQMIMAFKDFLNELRTGLTKHLTLQRGDAVFFYDKKVLHGRTAFTGDRFLLKGAIALKPVSIYE